MPKGQFVGYARVSTNGQSLEAQSEKLEAYGCVKLFQEKFTGTAREREQLNAVLAYIRQGDSLVVTKLDRLARSAVDLGNIVRVLQEKGVDLIVLDQKIDTSTPSGKLMFTMVAAFAEFERDLIVERCRDGIDRAKEKGVKFGRPPKLTSDQIEALKSDFNEGLLSKSELAAKYGISRPSIYRLVKKIQKNDKTAHDLV
ncbi:MAG: recombinase family protein [Ekhidna sp.]